MKVNNFNTFISKVLMWMCVGLVLTTLASLLVYKVKPLSELILGNNVIFFGLIILEILLVMIFKSKAEKMDSGSATLVFLVYSVVSGLTLSAIFFVYEIDSIVFVFLVASVMFGVMAMLGKFTKIDLQPLKVLLLMALCGVMLMLIVNMFIQSEGLALAISYIGVLLFCVLTAYDMQKLKILYEANNQDESRLNIIAINGALSLYLDLINLFLFLLRILGKRK